MKCSSTKKYSQVAVGVLAFLLGGGASAAPNTSWNSTPNWASGSNTTKKSSSSTANKRDIPVYVAPLAPFAPESNNLSLDVGQVFLMGDLGNKYADNLGMQVHYTYGVSEIFGFDSSFGYSGHSDGKLSLSTLLTGLRTNLTWYDKVVPYAVVGLGFYKPSIQIDELSSVSPIVFGLHMGPGVNLQLTNQLYFGASLTFHDMFGSNEVLPNGKVISVDGTFTSFLLNAGVSF